MVDNPSVARSIVVPSKQMPSDSGVLSAKRENLRTMVKKICLHVGVLAAVSVFFVFASGRSAYPQASPSPVEDAQVTFYSNAITLLGGLRGHDLGAFKGRIFDGDHELAFLEPAHFVTFRISPGLHVLSVASWVNKHSKPGAHLTMNIGAGQQYFVECGTTSFGPLFVIRDVACTRAQVTNQKTKPLEVVHVRPDGKPILVLRSSFPQCQ
jgi:hypothetical protein